VAQCGAAGTQSIACKGQRCGCARALLLFQMEGCRKRGEQLWEQLWDSLGLRPSPELLAVAVGAHS